MRKHLLKKGGIPALACTASATGDTSLLRCTFQVKYNSNPLQAAFSLRYNTQVHGIKDTQSFDLIYDADNISPTTTKCQVSTLSLSPEDGKYVTRNNFGEIRVLSLNLEKPCPIICPSVASCLVFSQDFIDLAKSQQIEILFDWTWLGPRYVESFMSVVSQPERFKGFPIVQNNLKGRKQGDWTIFSPEEEHALVSKEPPPYTDPVRNDPVRKRSQRDVSHSLSPPMKRICSIPPGSPTERATTASPTNSSIPMFSTIGKRQCTTSMHNESALSRSHNEELFLHNAEIDTNVLSISKDVISSMMLNILPAMLASVIGRPRSVSPSSSSSTELDTHPATVPSHKSIRQLRSLLTKHAAEYTEKQLRTIYENVEYDANLVRQAADEDLLAAMEEGKWDIKEQKENSLEELSVESNQIIQEKLVEFSDQLDLLVEQAWVNIEKAIDTRVERYTNTTWNKAIASGCLDQKPRVANKATREARAAGDRKRNHFGFCSRSR